MEVHLAKRRGMGAGLSVLFLLLILGVAGVASYMAFSQGTTGPSTTSTTPSVTTYHPTGSSTTSSTASVTTSSESSTSSLTTSSSRTTSTTTSSRTPTSTQSSTNKSQVVVIIPPGIENLANKVSFQPINVTVKIGVNNTVVFVNNDDQEHILESTSWPTGGQPFQLYSIPGTSVSVTLLTPGKYTYFCEWHPIWMDGVINVVA